MVGRALRAGGPGGGGTGSYQEEELEVGGLEMWRSMHQGRATWGWASRAGGIDTAESASGLIAGGKDGRQEGEVLAWEKGPCGESAMPVTIPRATPRGQGLGLLMNRTGIRILHSSEDRQISLSA